MTRRLYEILAPIVSIASLTALALMPLLAVHIADLEQRLAKRRAEIAFHEEFLVNCLSGRTMVVGRIAAVRCFPM